jgi:hypothetical protein
MPYSRIASLDLAYDRVGCDRLDLLGVTDRKWMRELWGEPEDHSTAAEQYENLLAADIQRIKADEEQERQERTERLYGNLYREIEEETDAAALPAPPKRQGLFGWLLGR